MKQNKIKLFAATLLLLVLVTAGVWGYRRWSGDPPDATPNALLDPTDPKTARILAGTQPAMTKPGKGGDPTRRGKAHEGQKPLAELSPPEQVSLMQAELLQKKKDALSIFHTIVTARPSGDWPKSLVNPYQCGDLASLAREFTLRIPQDPLVVSDDERAIVEALACQGKSQDALVEAKKYFNVATLKTTADAINLVSQMLTETGGDAAGFRSQQIAGASARLPSADNSNPVPATPSSSILSSIQIDPSAYTAALAATKKADTYDNLMARGNLLLLSDVPQNAEQCFLAATKAAGSKGGKKLTAAVEGVLRSIRAQTGTIGTANGLEFALIRGEPEPSLFPADALDPDALQSAASKLARSTLPPLWLTKNIVAAVVVPSTEPTQIPQPDRPAAVPTP